MPSFQSCILLASTRGFSTKRPKVAPPLTFSKVWLVAMTALLGTQPQFRHTPPTSSFSTHSTFCLSCPRRMAHG